MKQLKGAGPRDFLKHSAERPPMALCFVVQDSVTVERGILHRGHLRRRQEPGEGCTFPGGVALDEG